MSPVRLTLSKSNLLNFPPLSEFKLTFSLYSLTNSFSQKLTVEESYDKINKKMLSSNVDRKIICQLFEIAHTFFTQKNANMGFEQFDSNSPALFLNMSSPLQPSCALTRIIYLIGRS